MLSNVLGERPKVAEMKSYLAESSRDLELVERSTPELIIWTIPERRALSSTSWRSLLNCLKSRWQ